MAVTKNGVTYRWGWLHEKWLRRPFLVVATPFLFLLSGLGHVVSAFREVIWVPLKRTRAMKEILELW